MSCPHSSIGDPKFCSQCQGAKPRLCVYDEHTGQLTIDGVPVSRRGLIPITDTTRQKYGRRGKIASQQRTRNIDARNLDELDGIDDST
jgi:hypothetical protein